MEFEEWPASKMTYGIWGLTHVKKWPMFPTILCRVIGQWVPLVKKFNTSSVCPWPKTITMSADMLGILFQYQSRQLEHDSVSVLLTDTRLSIFINPTFMSQLRHCPSNDHCSVSLLLSMSCNTTTQLTCESTTSTTIYIAWQTNHDINAPFYSSFVFQHLAAWAAV